MHVTNPQEVMNRQAKTKGVATVRLDPIFYDVLSDHVKDQSETQRKKNGEEISLNKWLADAAVRKYEAERAALERSVQGRDNEQPPV